MRYHLHKCIIHIIVDPSNFVRILDIELSLHLGPYGPSTNPILLLELCHDKADFSISIRYGEKFGLSQGTFVLCTKPVNHSTI